MADNRPVQYRELTLNGRLRTYDDPAELVSDGGVVDVQTLQNIRYTDKHFQGIGGISKVNTTVLANPEIKNMFQFRKDSPSESAVVVSARDSNGLNQKVYKNDTAIPATGNFGSAIFTDATGYGNPMFSTAPTEKMIYCYGKDTAIWGGSEMKPIGFIDQDPNNTYKYDYTEQVKNALTDSNNIVTLHRRAETSDANTMLLLHLDDNVTDSSPTTVHTVTNTNVTFSTSVKKFGTHAAVFNGTSAQLSIPDNADFDFSGGIFTIDYWIKFTSTSSTQVIYHQGTDADNYIRISYTTGMPRLQVVAASTTVVDINPGRDFYPTQWVHYAWVENGDSWYLFINGQIVSFTSDTDRAADYTGVVYIGSSGATSYLNATVDEFRISDSARWTSTFDPPTLAYGSGNVTSAYVGSQLPIQGVNPYVLTANTTAGSVSGSYWSATGWASLGTISGVGAIPLSAAGKNTWTFTSTASTARQKSIDDKVAYWYRFDITECDTTTTLYQVTLDSPMQTLKELWDAQYRTANSFLVYKNSTFNDYTVNVFADSWSSADNASFVELDSLSSTSSIFSGFNDRQMGFRINLIGGHVNTTAGTSASVYYYNGTGPATTADSWTSVGTVDDSTVVGGISLAKSGTITWTPPELASEFRVSLSSSIKPPATVWSTTFGSKVPTQDMNTVVVNTPNLYYYKVVFSKNLSSDVQVFFVGGITAPEDVVGHKFSVHHVDRVWFWGSEKDPQAGFCTAKDTAQVLRGMDTAEIVLKNTPVAGVSLFERYGSTAANVQIVCEPTRTWAIIGETVENFIPTCIDGANGCTAPLTMAVATVEILPATFRRVAIWQSQGAIVMSDGSSVSEISRDIRDKFDPKHANYVGADVLPTCTGWFDPLYNEYHWVIPGVTQWVYDVMRKKWYEAPLAATKRLSCGCAIYDTNGVSYSYGATESGYMYRLENGTTIDSLGIPFVMKLGDIAHTGNISDRTEACSFRLIGKAKSTTTETVLLEHFGDSSSTASVPAIDGISMSNSGKRLFNEIRSYGSVIKTHAFHSYKLSVTTDDETIGFEPVFIVLGYKLIGKDFR